MAATESHWLCTNSTARRVPDRALRLLAGVLGLLDRLSAGRVPHSTWIRYRLDLEQARDPQAGAQVRLSPMDETIVTALTADCSQDRPQRLTAVRLWQHGLRRAYVWLEHGEPICMQWLFTPEDNPALRALPAWSGMYPPLPEGCGQVENLLAMGSGRRRRGGAATPFAYAMYEAAHARGLRRLITHIAESNTAARRWARRTGWVACGTIRRYHFNLPLLRRRHIYLHSTLPGRPLSPDPDRDPPAVHQPSQRRSAKRRLCVDN